MSIDYAPPVSKLLQIGRPKGQDWPNYIADYGITAAHIDELKRLFKDDQFWGADGGQLEGYGFIHALRALGQLRDESLLVYFIETLEHTQDNDWVSEDMPIIFSMLGPVAIPLLKDGLERNKQQSYIGATFAESLGKVALAHPESRDECVAVLIDQLERAEENDIGLNGFVISTLAIDLKAEEALPVIEEAFDNEYVDTMIMGDWFDVQVEFGLKEPDPNRKRPLNPFWQQQVMGMESGQVQRTSGRQDKSKKKAKRKQADKQRKQNRKRKK